MDGRAASSERRTRPRLLRFLVCNTARVVCRALRGQSRVRSPALTLPDRRGREPEYRMAVSRLSAGDAVSSAVGVSHRHCVFPHTFVRLILPDPA